MDVLKKDIVFQLQSLYVYAILMLQGYLVSLNIVHLINIFLIIIHVLPHVQIKFLKTISVQSVILFVKLVMANNLMNAKHAYLDMHFQKHLIPALVMQCVLQLTFKLQLV
jgi:hypothetical protein